MSKATPPLDRYGGHYSVQIDTSAYDLHYRYYVEPDPNAFEFRAILSDIYDIWGATETSECSRFKIINHLLESRVDPYLTYPLGVSRSTVPFNYNYLNVCKEGELFDNPIFWEAEIGKLSGAWSIHQSTSASSGQYISAGLPYGVDPSSGSAFFIVVAPEDGNYQMWMRTLPNSLGRDSFFVGVDTRAVGIMTISTSTVSNGWIWSHGSNYSLKMGVHYISFWAPEPNVGLDKFLMTEDTSYVP